MLECSMNRARVDLLNLLVRVISNQDEFITRAATVTGIGTGNLGTTDA